MAAVPLGTGGTGGNADAVVLQNIDDVLGGYAGDGQGQDVWRVVSAVDDQPVQIGKLGNGMRKQCLFPGGIRVKSGGQGGAGGGEAENGRGRFRAAAVASLLTAALQQRREGLQSGRDIQRAAALGTVDFMGRNGDQVRAQRLRGEGDFQDPCTASVWKIASGQSRWVSRAIC